MAEFNPTGETKSAPKPAAPGKDPLAEGGSLSVEKLNTIKADAANLLSMAKSGGFAVDPAGAKAIAGAYRQMLDRIPQLRDTLRYAAQAPALGSGPYAKQVAEFTKLAAKGDDQSFGAVLEALEVICETSAQAYETAAKNYNEIDEDAKQTFKSAEGEL